MQKGKGKGIGSEHYTTVLGAQ